MDRFIVTRFIVTVKICSITLLKNLKSNMDRFIVRGDITPEQASLNLKSNMDRFIGNITISQGRKKSI